MSHKAISRRTVLRGCGVCISLPLLEAMIPSRLAAAEAGSKRAKRLVTFSVPFGAVIDQFHPKESGLNYTLPPNLSPLKDLRDHFTCFSNYDHSLKGGHSANHTFMSGIKSSERAAYPDGNITVDQRVVELIGHNTRHPSLNFWDEGMSYTRSGVKVPPLRKPSDAFRLMFVDETSEQKKSSKAVIASSGSILDAVRESSKKFNDKLGKTDREKMEEYFTSIRGSENKIKAAGEWLDKPKKQPDFKALAKKGISEAAILQGDYDGTSLAGPLSEIWFDLIYLALQTDVTRVISLAVGNCTWGLPGTEESYHTLSHHGRKPEKLKQLSIIDIHLMTLFGRLIERVKATKDVDGSSMLDTTQFLFGSGLGSGQHINYNLPVLLAGGNFKHGQHLDNKQDEPLCNLYLQMLQQFDPTVKRFNKSAGTITGLDNA